MVTFSCKKISQEELIRCAFGLNKTEYNVLLFLLKQNKERVASQISEDMGLDRTTVQKAIKNLADKELAERVQRNLSGGGYTFLYKPKDKKEIRYKMKKVTREWYNGIEEAIDRL